MNSNNPESDDEITIKTPQYAIVGPVESFTAGVSRHHVLKHKEKKPFIIRPLIIFEKN
jgi:hypothetical protein